MAFPDLTHFPPEGTPISPYEGNPADLFSELPPDLGELDALRTRWEAYFGNRSWVEPCSVPLYDRCGVILFFGQYSRKDVFSFIQKRLSDQTIYHGWVTMSSWEIKYGTYGIPPQIGYVIDISRLFPEGGFEGYIVYQQAGNDAFFIMPTISAAETFAQALVSSMPDSHWNDGDYTTYVVPPNGGYVPEAGFLI